MTTCGYAVRPCCIGIRLDRDAGLQPWAVVANAGATNTGTVDALAEVSAVCRAEGLWLHVDAAYGWVAALDAGERGQLAGIADADSVTLDPHKWLAQTFDVGCLFVRDGRRLPAAFASRPDYLQDVAPGHDEEVNYADYGIALTRRFRALKVWLSVQVLGLDWFRRLADHGCALADYAQARLEVGRRVRDPVPAAAEYRLLPVRPPRTRDAGRQRPPAGRAPGDGPGVPVVHPAAAGRSPCGCASSTGGRPAADVDEVVDLLVRLGVEVANVSGCPGRTDPTATARNRTRRLDGRPDGRHPEGEPFRSQGAAMSTVRRAFWAGSPGWRSPWDRPPRRRRKRRTPPPDGEEITTGFRSYVVAEPRFPKEDVRNRIGKMQDLVTDHGLEPTIAVFSRTIPADAGNPLAALVKKLDELQEVKEFKARRLGAFLVFLALKDEFRKDETSGRPDQGDRAIRRRRHAQAHDDRAGGGDRDAGRDEYPAGPGPGAGDGRRPGGRPGDRLLQQVPRYQAVEVRGQNAAGGGGPKALQDEVAQALGPRKRSKDKANAHGRTAVGPPAFVRSAHRQEVAVDHRLARPGSLAGTTSRGIGALSTTTPGCVSFQKHFSAICPHRSWNWAGVSGRSGNRSMNSSIFRYSSGYSPRMRLAIRFLSAGSM